MPTTATTSASSAYLVLIGNELLTGKIVDSNGAHAIAALRAAGIALAGIEVIPDEIPRIVETLRRVQRDPRPDVIITSGGVGPTHDDVTMEAVALALGRPMVRDANLAERLTAHYGPGRINAELLSMARVPQGCELFYPDGSAFPLFRNTNVWSLPGEPGFFVRKIEWLVAHLSAAAPAGSFVTRRVHCQCDEGQIAALLRALQTQFAGVAIGSYPRYNPDGSAWWTLVTLDSRDAGLVDAALERLLGDLPGSVVSQVDRD